MKKYFFIALTVFFSFLSCAQVSAANTLIPLIQQMGYKEENIKISFRKEFNFNDLKMLFDQTSIEK